MNKIVYTDEQDLRIYESLPPTDFKEFFMAYFKYNKGEKVEVTDFTNPITYALFNSYIPKLDKMEDNYNKKANANRENGKKGGRPKKQITIEPNSDFNIDANKADLSASKPSVDNLYHREVESGSNGLKTGKEEEIGINANIDNKMGTLTNIIQKEDGTFEKIDLPRENEMLETLLSDEEIIEKVAKEFIETEGDGGYNMFIKLNTTDPKSDEFRVLWNKWCHKWNRYNTTEERARLIGDITDRVCKNYFNRYKEVA